MAKLSEDCEVKFNRDELIYTSCYCEENVWKLLESLLQTNENLKADEIFAVFISNQNKTIPIWYQKKSESIETPVVWDYHVIAVYKSNACKQSFAYDLDTLLDFPEKFSNYLEKALPILPNMKRMFHRVVPAEYYLKNFASDRSHMIDKNTGLYSAQPPNYPCIECKFSKNNANEYIDMKSNSEPQHGVVMNQQEFKSFFTNF